MNRRILALAAVAVAGMGAGGAISADIFGAASVSAVEASAAVAESPAAPADTPSSTTPAAAGAFADEERPDGDIDQHISDALAPLVTDGTLTQAQADKVVETLIAAMPERGRGRHHGEHPRLERLRAGVEAAATVLGMTPDELRTELSDGATTIADVATAKGVDVAKVVTAIVDGVTTQVNAAVADGSLTQARADKILSGLNDRITTMVNEVPRQRGGRGPGGHGRGGFDDAQGSDAADAPAEN